MDRYTVIRSQKPRFSFRVDKRSVTVICILALLLIVAIVVSIGMGSIRIPVSQVLKSLVGLGEGSDQLVILQLRLPRIVVAVLVGASLAVSGSILQALVRNPLASPDLIGTTSGATAAAVAFIAFSNGTYSIHWLPLVALVGGFFAASLTYVTAWKHGLSPFRFALIGVSISTAMGALTIYFMISGPMYLASQALGWMSGTVYGSSWNHVLSLLPWTLIFLVMTMVQARTLNAQELGDDVAKGVGVPVERKRLMLIAISVALAAAAVGIAGGIGFVGLMAPHMARKLVGSSYGSLLPASAILGAFFVLLADLAARTLFVPLDIPAGVFTAAVGAPFFMLLLYRSRSA
ncbi:iron ABC transporter permease [Brevibacillus reuszeri]|uniref:Iron ABC transporter permease n=1 Tax=Brevibacillus reuszeri TaxID=54915 RepID=A0A0K9YN36_9BACL|nr:iron ABC transporter permease [Brevibacillus reuszeri]KNB70062.1 iron ABC transporter permease [Brevibacillus reuszeri]MED1857083.1 iron ABC transporter permease [Brevibacillus reuszeri]GED72683.1 iron ABC transporter permease [Brevibacillus reuszeri]